MHEILKYWIPYLSDFYARTVLELFGFLNNEFKLEKPCVKIIFQTKPYWLTEIQPYSETVNCKILWSILTSFALTLSGVELEPIYWMIRQLHWITLAKFQLQNNFQGRKCKKILRCSWRVIHFKWSATIPELDL